MAHGGRTLYEVLGCDQAASPTELKRAWRRRLLEVHPDHGGSVADTLEVQAAYDVLGDDARRRDYDRELAAAQAADGPQATRTDDLLSDLAQQFAEAFAQQFAEAFARGFAEAAREWARQYDEPDDSGATAASGTSQRSRRATADEPLEWARSTGDRAGIRFCASTTKKGRPCMATARPGSDFCQAHDPNRRLCAGFSGRSGTRPCRATALAGQPYCYWHANLYATYAADGAAPGADSDPPVASDRPDLSTVGGVKHRDPDRPPLATVGAAVTGAWVFLLGPLVFVILVKWMLGDFSGEDADIDKRLAVALAIAIVDLAIFGRVIAATGRLLASQRDVGGTERVAWGVVMLIATSVLTVMIYREMPTPNVVTKMLVVGMTIVAARLVVGLLDASMRRTSSELATHDDHG
ncbi:MAG: DnaJ domain-containing protein [Ilumatobacter sp.]|nr:DnaJ domain-containing protein [Ilumatobacter sp.]